MVSAWLDLVSATGGQTSSENRRGPYTERQESKCWMLSENEAEGKKNKTMETRYF